MSLGFIWGRMPADRTKKVLDLAFEEAKSGSKKPILILVPEKYTYEMEKKLSQRLLVDSDPNFRIRVVSFSTLSNIVFTNVAGLKEKKISKSARTMLVYRALEKSEKDLKTFKPTSNSIGLVSKLLDLLIEFKQNDMDIDYVKSLPEKVDDRALATKLLDISKVYETYEDLMQDKYMDSEDGIEMFSRLLDSYEPLKGASIFIDEFTGFTPIQYLVIEKLILLSNITYISLMTDLKNRESYRGVFAKTNATFMKINKFCHENNINRIEDIRIDPQEDYYRSDDLIFLENEIRYFNPKVYKANDSTGDELKVKIASFDNRHREVEYVASKILDLVKNHGYRFGQIMVATRDMESYAHIAKSIFDDYKINYFLDDKIRAKSNPVLAFILSILDMKNTNYSYKSMFAYFKSGTLDIDSDDISLLENYVLANGIKGKKWFEDKWEMPIVHSVEDGQVDMDMQERINNIKNDLIEPIASLNKKLGKRNTLRQISTYLYEFVLDIGLDKRVSCLVDNFEKEEDNYRAREYSQAWNIFVDVLDEMVEFMGDEVIGLDRYIRFLELQFQGHELGIIPPSRDQVFITGVDRMKNPDTRILFLMGTNEGVFPQTIGDDNLITEMDKASLLEKGIKFDSDVVTKMYDEEFLVYRAMSTAREDIYVTYPKGDIEGNSMMASSLVTKLKKIFPSLVEEDTSDLVYDIGFKLGNSDDMSDVDGKNTEYGTRGDESKDSRNIDKGPIENYEYKLGLEIADLIYGRPIFSISKLEKFSSCPYSYFAKYGLRARPRDVYEFSPMDAGNYYHKVLELFLRRVRSNDISWADVDLAYITREVDIIGSRILEAKSSYILNSSDKYKYMVKRLNKTLVDSIDIIGKQVRGGMFRPKGLEVTFGIKSDLDPIELDTPGGKKGIINGKIDRLDTYIDQETNTEYVSIVDYKLSSQDIKLEMVEAGLQLQLFMYMNAVINSKSSKYTSRGMNMKPAALLYSRVNSQQVELDDIYYLEDMDGGLDKKLLKANKLKGIVVKDKDLYKMMDTEFEKKINTDSSILPIKLLKDGKFPSRVSGFDEAEFDIISRYVIKKSEDIIDQIYGGNIQVRPYKIGNRTGCDYCEYRSICQFEYDNYRKIRADENIIDRMTLYNFNKRKESKDDGK